MVTTIYDSSATLLGSISAMRSGILKTLSDVFLGIPVRIRLMHFLKGPKIINEITAHRTRNSYLRAH